MNKLILYVLIASTAWSCGPNLTLEEHYDNWESVKKSGSISRGWLPIWLPVEARNIHEKHNLDSSAIAFSFELSNPNFFLNELDCLDVSSAPKPYIKISSFPKNIHKTNEVKLCNEFYIFHSDSALYLWRNKPPNG